MPTGRIPSKLARVVKEIAEHNHDRGRFKKESHTETMIVEPILTALGWDITKVGGEVINRHNIEGGREEMDYYISCPGPEKSFRIVIEAKKSTMPWQKLLKQEAQLGRYVNEVGAQLGVLTNGFDWFLYTPELHVPWKECRF